MFSKSKSKTNLFKKLAALLGVTAGAFTGMPVLAHINTVTPISNEPAPNLIAQFTPVTPAPTTTIPTTPGPVLTTPGTTTIPTTPGPVPTAPGATTIPTTPGPVPTAPGAITNPTPPGAVPR